MKQTIQRLCLFLILLAATSQIPLHAQNLTGIWRGYFVTSNYDQYKFELQIKHSTGAISGVSYSYLNTSFYGKAVLTGNYNKSTQDAVVREIKTVELRMDALSTACIMKCIFEYSKSGKEEFLEGTFTSVFEKSEKGRIKGDDCGGGKVYLRKVVTSDFYVEPFLRKKEPVTNPPIAKTNPPAVTKPLAKPQVNKPITKPTTRSTPPNNTTTSRNTTRKPVIDTVKKTEVPPPVVKKDPVPVAPTPNVLKSRANELVKTLVVRDEDVIVKLFDNGEIDDDTISVYLDKKLVLSAKRLTASPLIVRLKMDEDNSEHELVMVAENLGKIPPNTSLMLVESGDQRFDVRITSTEQKNAVVRFRYEKRKQ